MNIEYRYTGNGAEEWENAAKHFVLDSRKYMVEKKYTMSFSPANNVEIIVSCFEADAKVDILCIDDIFEELPTGKCVGIGKSMDDMRILIADDAFKYRKWHISFYLPGQVIGEREQNGTKKTIIAPRLTQAQMHDAIEDNHLTDEREGFGRKMAFYMNEVSELLMRLKLMRNDEQILAVGITGD